LLGDWVREKPIRVGDYAGELKASLHEFSVTHMSRKSICPKKEDHYNIAKDLGTNQKRENEEYRGVEEQLPE